MKFAILALGFGLVFFGSFWVGRYDVSPMQTLRILLDWLLRTVSRGRLFLIQTWQAREQAVVINVRLPRVAAAALVGAALSTAGCSYQGMFRNPMVSPDLLGASTGAGFGAALGHSARTRLRRASRRLSLGVRTCWRCCWRILISRVSTNPDDACDGAGGRDGQLAVHRRHFLY